MTALRNHLPAVLLASLAVVAFTAKFRLDRSNLAKLSSPSDLIAEEAGYQGQSLKKYGAGFDQMLAGALWVALLQSAKSTPVKDGRVSWEFAQLDAITTLDPLFDPPYPFGHAFLSVFRRDNEGAKRILEKWVKRRPTHWRAHYLLGYHLYFEMQNYADAAPVMLRASQLEGAPPWIAALGIRIFEQGNLLGQALSQSVEFYETLQAGEAKERLKFRIRSIRYNLAKSQIERARERFVSKYKRNPTSMGELIAQMDGSLRQPLSLAQQEVPAELEPILRETFQFTIGTDGSIRPVDAKAQELEKTGLFSEDKAKGKQ